MSNEAVHQEKEARRWSHLVISSYATVAKSNSVLMASHMHLFRRPQQLGCHYYERQGPVPGLVCRRFKLSCHQSSLPCPYPTRTCASVPADGPADEIVPSLAKDPNVEAEKKRALQYTNDSKKPNVHIGLHYELVKDEYGLPSHIHVLIGEEKHRWVGCSIVEGFCIRSCRTLPIWTNRQLFPSIFIGQC